MTKIIHENLFDVFIRNRKTPKFLEWWEVENTGWSNGTSWFSTGARSADPRRFDSKQEAIDFALRRKQDLDDPKTKWRYIHVTLEQEGNKTVTTEVWEEI